MDVCGMDLVVVDDETAPIVDMFLSKDGVEIWGDSRRVGFDEGLLIAKSEALNFLRRAYVTLNEMPETAVQSAPVAVGNMMPPDLGDDVEPPLL